MADIMEDEEGLQRIVDPAVYFDCSGLHIITLPEATASSRDVYVAAGREMVAVRTPTTTVAYVPAGHVGRFESQRRMWWGFRRLGWRWTLVDVGRTR